MAPALIEVVPGRRRGALAFCPRLGQLGVALRPDDYSADALRGSDSGAGSLFRGGTLPSRRRIDAHYASPGRSLPVRRSSAICGSTQPSLSSIK